MMSKFIMTSVLTIASWLMLFLFLFTFIGLYGAMANVQEDDATFNCYVMGDLNCGPTAVWHGFVNLD